MIELLHRITVIYTVWFILSIPFAVVVGKCIKDGRGPA